MIIDVNTRIWTSLDQLGRETASRIRAQKTERWGQADASLPAHEQAMSCVDGALVFGYRSELQQAEIPNELVAEIVAKNPRRRIGIAGIDPMSPDSLLQLEHAISLGLQGVTISPSTQGFHPSHSSAMRIYDRCVELSLPLFVTMPYPLTTDSVLEFGRPLLWDEIMRTLPDLRLVLSQMGQPWIDETLVLLSKHDHVYADISGVASRPWQLYNALLSATEYQVMDKLLFGSGFPYELPEKAIELLYTVNAFSQGTQLPSIPRSQIRGIVERNSLECLGIEAEITDLKQADDVQTMLPTEIEYLAGEMSIKSGESIG
ncbi:MAG: amidohydrolase family protein [Planctomycetota bacterium]|nr:amidohydrolase family protein [Planctomycetota bacterium]